MTRGMDPGIGDGWEIPLGHGYSFFMIDVPEKGFIAKTGFSGGVPEVQDIVQLTEVGDSVVGLTDSNELFRFDLVSGKLTTEGDPLAEFSPRPALDSAFDFYRSHRLGWQDILAGILLLAAQAGTAWFWFSRFIRSPADLRHQ